MKLSSAAVYDESPPNFSHNNKINHRISQTNIYIFKKYVNLGTSVL